MIEKFIDEYEVKARLAPGLIVSLPALVDAIHVVPSLSNWPIFAAGGIISLVLLYGVGHVIRAAGQQLEPTLWKQWSGPPSTRLMRSSDTFFGAELKNSIRAAVTQEFGITLPTSEQEKTDPNRSDKAIGDAFGRVRGFLRHSDPTGVWQKNNIEYGFCRNLLGGRILWASVATGSLVVAIWYSATNHSGFLNPAVVVSSLSLLIAGYVGWHVLPKATKRTAERYAELAWTTFLQVSKGGKQPVAPSRLGLDGAT
jgi:hypothetical protein